MELVLHDLDAPKAINQSININVLGTMSTMCSVRSSQGARYQGCENARYYVYSVLGTKPLKVLGTMLIFFFIVWALFFLMNLAISQSVSQSINQSIN